MSGLPVLEADEENVLDLRTYPNQPWQPYTAFTKYFVPDYNIPGGSKEWATYQKLLKAAWTVLNRAQANNFQTSANLELKV